MSLIDELLRSKYANIIFYCHNLGGYDIVFILNKLLAYNDNINYVSNINESKDNHKYLIDCKLRNKDIIKIKISKASSSGKKKYYYFRQLCYTSKFTK